MNTDEHMQMDGDAWEAPAAEAAPGEDAAVPEEERAAPAKKRKRGRIREDLEAIILAIIFVIVIREYVAEAYKIPTGSMEPTLMGNNNGHENGDNIIVDKAYYWFHPVERWDVVVFKYPKPSIMSMAPECDWYKQEPPSARTEGPGSCAECHMGNHESLDKNPRVVLYRRNFIKRCVALPGEKIEIKHGDIYITNNSGLSDEIPAKPHRIQEALWQKVYFCDFDSEDPFKLKKARRDLPPWSVKGLRHCKTGDGVLVTDANKGRDITFTLDTIRDTRIGKNNEIYENDKGTDYSGTNLVGDLMIEANVEFRDEGSSIALVIEEDDCVYTVRLGCAKSDVTCVYHNDTDRKRRENKKVDFRFKTGVQYKVRFINVDDRLSLWVDSKIAWGEYRLPEEDVRPQYVNDKESCRAGASVTIDVDGGEVKFRSLNIYRDIYYTDRSGTCGVDKPYRIPERCYFALGDNSANSSDSRKWGTFPRENLIGKACFVFFPIYPVYDIKKKRLEFDSRLKLIR